MLRKYKYNKSTYFLLPLLGVPFYEFNQAQGCFLNTYTTISDDNLDISTPIQIDIFWISSSTSGNVEWVLITSITNDTATLGFTNATNAETTTSVITTVSGVQFQLNQSTIVFDPKNIVPGESIINFAISRDARNANVNDTMAASAVLYEMRIRSTRWKLGK